MAKSDTGWLFLVVAIVAAFFIFGKGFNFGSGSLMAAGDITSAIVTRTMPTEVQPSATFDATYVTSGAGAGSWGVLITDGITGGCTPTAYNSGKLNTDPDLVKTYTAPASGTCTFAGTYQYSGTAVGTEKPIAGTTTISVINCATLKTAAISAIATWTSTLTSAAKTTALTAIQTWATRC